MHDINSRLEQTWKMRLRKSLRKQGKKTDTDF